MDYLYRVLETGKLDVDDIAPRIKALREEIDVFKTQQNELTQDLQRPLPMINQRQLQLYVNSLRQILSEGTIFEQKNFIKSFVKKITVFENKVVIEYTYPVSNETNAGYMEEVLCSELKSPPGKTFLELIKHL